MKNSKKVWVVQHVMLYDGCVELRIALDFPPTEADLERIGTAIMTKEDDEAGLREGEKRREYENWKDLNELKVFEMELVGRRGK